MIAMNMTKLWMLAAFLTICGASVCNAQQGDQSAMGYPQAEWSRAGDILMHTPGQELFNGVIHPSAGLFEDYFDVDKAAEEHRGYIEMLRKNGIRVHSVTDILDEVGIDSLRGLAEKVLVYDINIIPIDDDDEMHYANNFLTIAPRHIMAVGGQSEEKQQRFHDAGVTVEWIPLESLINGYGAAHCMTQVLQREAIDGSVTGLGTVRQAATEQSPTRRYRLDGTPATDATRGIVVENGRKTITIKQ